ncbi:WD40 repeat-like protein [Aspergillus heteromorphus CBS 117.55]|uniref:WD40 repeat-like protein n=1 Tax=Aspergillus heteromorphus CBS 117.55 TaxID=1448321 RepID=A0A317VBC9_9EURO|nr:WD40 repeat-like protein [Aspergillus heteromorphus CBS 117.55]PWY71664.1 WD40 repeat-like protein [Aspergillus heteromorphus CBS 117.55]
MANNSFSVRSKAAAPGSSLRITPSNSPILRPPTRSSAHRAPLHQANLTLQTVIGTTTTTPHGFACHEQSRSFALCAGSTAVLAELDDENRMNQRFFKARPSATSVNPVTSFYGQSTPPSTPDSRAKFSGSARSSAPPSVYGTSPSNDPTDNGSPRGWSSRERVKAVTCTAISPNGRFLAVGETGYSPRVLVFSTAKDASPEVPLSILTEHTFGVRGLAFSSDSQYLATLGDVNDGFLFVWSVNLKNGSAKLHSTNKCTTSVRDMCWMGQTLITVGVRHVKVWRLPDARPGSPRSRLTVEASSSSPNQAPRAFSGRNCLLGSLVESTFACVAGISDREAVLGTETGALCFLDDSEGSQKLCVVQHMEFGITSLAVDSSRSCIWIGGRGRQIQRLTFEKIRASTIPSSPTLSGRSSAEQSSRGPAVIGMGSLGSHLVAVDTTNNIDLYPNDRLGDDVDQMDAETTVSAHRDAVLGICPLQTPNELEADFFTWSRKGAVNFWNIRGKCKASHAIALEHPPGYDEEASNELKVLRTTQDMEMFVSGDKFGVLRIFLGQSWKSVHEVRAHGGEIMDIAIHMTPETCLVASSGRDRMIQLFERTDDSLQLIQTMDDHVGAVGQLLFIDNGERLVSCSADRTIHVRDRVSREVNGTTIMAYMISKVITMKASPVSMTPSTDDPDTLVVSTADRCIHQYDLASGRQLGSFRAIDSDGTDTVVMSSLTMMSQGPRKNIPKLITGMSGTDKSIRVYDLDRGVLLAGEFGHTEGISDVCLLENHPDIPGNERVLISSGLDGLVMIWGLSVSSQSSHDFTQTIGKADDDVPVKEMTVAKPPLRRILSRSELAGFQRQENVTVTPTPARGHSPTFLRKFSKFTLSPAPKSGNTSPTTPSSASNRRPSPTSSARREKTHTSPCPPSSKPTSTRKAGSSRSESRRSSLDLRARARNTAKSDLGGLNTSTEQVCRQLKAFRKRLNGSTEHIHAQRELERELGLTLRVLSSRGNNSESAETETDSSGKENEKLPASPSHNAVHTTTQTSSQDIELKEPPKITTSIAPNMEEDGACRG